METTTELSETFDPATEEGTLDFAPLPKGSYVACVIEAAVKPFKSGRGQAVFVTWEVDDEKYHGRRIWDSYALSHENEMTMKLGRAGFKDLCTACGITAAFNDLTMLNNKPCLIFMRIEEDKNGDYPPKNRVTKVKPIATAKPAAEPAAKPADKPPFNDEVPW
jgi:hypothetical protein